MQNVNLDVEKVWKNPQEQNFDGEANNNKHVATRLTLVLNVLILFFVFILFNTGTFEERFHIAYMITTIITSSNRECWFALQRKTMVNSWVRCLENREVIE